MTLLNFSGLQEDFLEHAVNVLIVFIEKGKARNIILNPIFCDVILLKSFCSLPSNSSSLSTHVFILCSLGFLSGEVTKTLLMCGILNEVVLHKSKLVS